MPTISCAPSSMNSAYPTFAKLRQHLPGHRRTGSGSCWARCIPGSGASSRLMRHSRRPAAAPPRLTAQNSTPESSRARFSPARISAKRLVPCGPWPATSAIRSILTRFIMQSEISTCRAATRRRQRKTISLPSRSQPVPA